MFTEDWCPNQALLLAQIKLCFLQSATENLPTGVMWAVSHRLFTLPGNPEYFTAAVLLCMCCSALKLLTFQAYLCGTSKIATVVDFIHGSLEPHYLKCLVTFEKGCEQLVEQLPSSGLLSKRVGRTAIVSFLPPWLLLLLLLTPHSPHSVLQLKTSPRWAK